MLEVNFSSDSREASAFGLTQWDKGQKLSFFFEDMPDKFQVHFSSRGSNEAVVVDAVTENGRAVVNIPDELLTYDSDIQAWIYITGDNSGETIGRATLYVRPRPRPKGYMEGLVPSQQQLVEAMITELKEKVDYALGNGVDSEYVPEYVKQESFDVANKVLASQNENTFTFFAASDFHSDVDDHYTEKAIEHMSQAMKIIRSVCKVDFAVCLGDYIADGKDKAVSDAQKAFMKINKALSDGLGDMPCLRAVGAEDLLSQAYYRNADYFNCDELYTFIGKWNADAVFNSDDVTGGYCYKDFEDAKLRIICLNTSDFKKDVAVKPETDKAYMSPAQLQWLCDALDLSSKSKPSAWSIMIFSHFPADYYSNFTALKNILKAYMTGKKVQFLLDSTEINFTFSGKNSAVILGLFNGALHNLRTVNLSEVNLPLIGVPNVCHGESNYFADEKYTSDENLAYGESATWEKLPSSADDTSFCVITVDKSKGKIYIHCYGAGYDRELSFDSIGDGPGVPGIGGGPGGSQPGGSGGTDSGGSDSGGTDSGDSGSGESGSGDNTGGGNTSGTYTNLVPVSVDASGNIFNGCGYRNGKYIDEGDDEYSDSSFTVSGYIPCENGDVIRINGGNWSDSEGNTLLIYDDTMCLIWSALLSGEADSESGITYNGDTVVFRSLDVDNGNISDMTYMRVSCEGDGRNLIVTVNEEITQSSGSSGDTPPVVSGVNIIPYSTDEYDDIYNNGLGYRDGYALGDDGEVDESAPDSRFTHTGYLYGEKGSVFRLKGYNWTSDEGNYLMVYDTDYVLYHTVRLSSQTNDSKNGISFSSGVMTFDTSKVTATQIPNEFFIRVSTKASGANLYMTYNEDLT